MDRKELRAIRVMQGRKVRRAHKDNKEKLVLKVIAAHKDIKATRVNQDRKAVKAHRATRGI